VGWRAGESIRAEIKALMRHVYGIVELPVTFLANSVEPREFIAIHIAKFFAAR
jgi:hypothetical protein